MCGNPADALAVSWGRRDQARPGVLLNHISKYEVNIDRDDLATRVPFSGHCNSLYAVACTN